MINRIKYIKIDYRILGRVTEAQSGQKRDQEPCPFEGKQGKKHGLISLDAHFGNTHFYFTYLL